MHNRVGVPHKSSYDGSRLVLVTGHGSALLVTLLLAFAGASGTVALLLLIAFIGEPNIRVAVLCVVLAVVLVTLIVVGVVRRIRKHPRPALFVTPDGVDVRSYGERIQVPWDAVRSVDRRLSPLGDMYYAVDVDPAFWERLGRRWHEPRKGGVHGDLDDVSDLVTFPVKGITMAEALRHTREIAPDHVRVHAPR